MPVNVVKRIGLKKIICLVFFLLVLICWVSTRSIRPYDNFFSINTDSRLSPVEKIPAGELKTADLILLGARQEVQRKTIYDASYQKIPYPMGDVPLGRGACTDVVIRALRNAGIDLQELIHQDMKKHFSLYPQLWSLKAPDSNIDHRRVPNLVCFLKRHGLSLSIAVEGNLEQWQWGDIVFWRFPNGLEHCGIISDRKNEAGVPLVIENSGQAQEADLLQYWQITGHYRYPPADEGL